MDDERRLEWEAALDELLSDTPAEEERTRLLRAICRDAGVRQLLEELIDARAQARAAFGYDQAGPQIAARLPRLLAAVAAGEAGRDDRDHPGDSLSLLARLMRPGKAWQIAALVLIAVSLLFAYVEHRNHQRLRTEVDQLARWALIPAIRLPEGGLEQIRTARRLIAQDPNTWILMSDGEGTFGSVRGIEGGLPATDDAILLHCRLLDSEGRAVYSADLLVPERPQMHLKLPDAGQVAGLPATLTVSMSGNLATVGFSIKGKGPLPVGVMGQAPLDGGVQELGRFQLDRRPLRFCVKPDRFSDVGT